MSEEQSEFGQDISYDVLKAGGKHFSMNVIQCHQGMGRVNMKPEEQSSVQKFWGSSSNVRLFREKQKLNVDALVVCIICHQGMGRVNIKPEE